MDLLKTALKFAAILFVGMGLPACLLFPGISHIIFGFVIFCTLLYMFFLGIVLYTWPTLIIAVILMLAVAAKFG